ncbi:MAG: hydrogenase maturation nickel metallochaperone HypA [Euryarchaeota archaeon]|nr:hydrogenase maturation nickel metallochaperone HypA [Euryarchaeota archaeon]
MHEYSITSQIVENVLQEAKKHDAKKIFEVHLVIGKFTFLGIEQVRFSYEILVKGTIMEGSKLYIEERNGVVKCAGCGYEGTIMYEDDPKYHILFPTLYCPKCRSKVDLIEGKECIIKSVKLMRDK